MGHSAEYQTDLYIKQLERIAQTLLDQGVSLRDAGYDKLGDSVFEQASQLKRAIVELRKMMEE